MKNCTINAKTNGAESILYKKLEEIVGETGMSKENVRKEALELWNYVTDEKSHFKDMFGDYEEAYRVYSDPNNDNTSYLDYIERTDENGEPLLFFNKSLNRYYFKDKFGERFLYPTGKTDLGRLFYINDIREFVKGAALEYFISQINFNIDKFSFESTSIPEGLDIFIEDYIDKVGNKLLASNDFSDKANGFKLKQSKSYIDTWVSEVKDYFATLKIKHTEQEYILRDNKQLEEQSPKDTLFRVSSMEKSAKDNINNNIKLFLSTFKDKDGGKKNIFKEDVFIPFDDIFSTLNKALANVTASYDSNGIEDEFQLYLDKIETLSKIKPYFKTLHNELSKQSDEFKNAFVSAFRLHKNNYLGSETVVDKKGRVTYAIKNYSDVGSRKNNIILQWFFNYEVQDTKLSALYKKFRSKATEFGKQVKTIRKSNNIDGAIKLLRQDLNSIGVSTTAQGFDYFLSGLTGEEATFDDKLNTIYKVYNDVKFALQDSTKAKDDNLFVTQNIFKEIAEAEAFFLDEMSDATIYTLGKTKWVYSNPSYLGLKIEQWKRNPYQLLSHYRSTPYNSNSLYINYLLALDETGNISDIELAKSRLENLQLFVFNSVQSERSFSKSSDNNDITFKDSLVDYVNKVLSPKSYKKTALASDVATEFQISYGIPLTKARTTIENGYVTDIGEEGINIVLGYVMDEWNRIQTVANEIEDGNTMLIEHYHTKERNGLKFQLFPSLNENTELFDLEGNPLGTVIEGKIEQDIKDKIKKELIDKINNRHDLLIEERILEENIEGEIENNNIDEAIFNNYSDYGNKASYALVGDMVLNSLISQVEYTKLFSGDIAYFKFYADFQKRVKGGYTDGKYLRLVPGEEIFNIGVIESVKIPEPYLNELKKYLPERVWKDYLNVNSTDAQAWITPERWEFLIRKSGKWSPTHDSIMVKMYKNNPKYNTRELKLLAQPLKGVYYDVKNGIPTFLKYSQAVLIPNLVKNSDLQILYNAMVLDEKGDILPYKDQVHELITRDGIKVGLPVPAVSHLADGKIDPNFRLTEVMQLNNNAWKLQQDLPTKGFKSTVLGTQIKKNIFQGLTFFRGNDKVKFDVAGTEYNAEALIVKLNGVMEAIGDKSVSNFISELGLDDNYKIINEDILYEGIIKQLKGRNDVPTNVMRALKNRTSPFAIPGGLELFQNVFSTKVNSLIDIRTMGGGFIQMADYGMTRKEAEKSGIIFTPWFDEQYDRLHPPRIVKQKGKKDKIIPGGVFISGNLIAKYVPNYRELDSEQLFGENGLISPEILKKLVGYRIPNQGLPSNDALQVLGILPEGVADTVVAYAGITTKTGSDFDIDKMYLMLPSFEVESEELYTQAYDYLRESNITEEDMNLSMMKLGFPIDLDSKTLRNVFVNNALVHNNTNEDYHEDFFNEASLENVKLKYIQPDWNTPLHEQSMEQLQNMLIDIYQSVLLHPENMESIMKSLDTDLLERDIANLNVKEQEKDLEIFDVITDIELKSKFRAAKQGLGQAVNYIMDYVRGTMAPSVINEVALVDSKSKYNWGNSPKGEDISFDEEYSEELSNTELKEYVEDFNKNQPDNPITLEEIKELSKVKIADSLIAISSAFVDAANKPFIINANWVTQTNNLALMLIRAGVHPFKVNAFINSQVLKDYIRYQTSIESNTTFEKVPLPQLNFSVQRHIKELKNAPSPVEGERADRLFRRLYNIWDISKYSSNLDEKSSEKMVKRLNKNINKYLGIKGKKAIEENQPQIKAIFDFMLNQYDAISFPTKQSIGDFSLVDFRNNNVPDSLILDIYFDWTIVAKSLSKGVGAARVDIDGKGKNIGSLISNINSINDLITEAGDKGKLNGWANKLKFNGHRTALGVAIDNALLLPYNIMRANPKYFLTASDTVVNTANIISMHIYGETLNNELLAKDVMNSYYTYILSGFAPFRMDNRQKADLILKIPSEFEEMQKKYSDNPLLQELYPKKGLAKAKYIAMPNLKKPVSYKNSLVDGFKDLLADEPVFAERLIKYAYLTSGFNLTMGQFHEFIPYEWLNEKGINTYLKSIELSNLDIDYNFIDAFFRNNIENDRYITTVWNIENIKGIESYNAIKLFKLSNDEIPSYLIKHIDKSYEPGVADTIRYYSLAGINDKNEPIYVRTTPLGRKDGKGNNFVEYNINSAEAIGQVPSLYKENNAIRMSKTLNLEKIKALRDALSLDDVASLQYMITEEYGLGSVLEDIRVEDTTPIFKKCR